MSKNRHSLKIDFAPICLRAYLVKVTLFTKLHHLVAISTQLADHIKDECLNRRRSLHERGKGEIIIKEGSTIDRTATVEKEGQHKLGQQPGLKSSGRPTVGTNSSNLDHCGHKNELQR